MSRDCGSNGKSGCHCGGSFCQAEHDTDARPILIASGDGANRLVSDVNESLAKQLKTLHSVHCTRGSCSSRFCCDHKQYQSGNSCDRYDSTGALGGHDQRSDEISRQLSCYGGLFVGTQSAGAG